MKNSQPRLNVRALYDAFAAPLCEVDCGQMCAPHNPAGVPFCCDICQAVPAAYQQEWEYLRSRSDLWHMWRGDECPSDTTDLDELRADTPENMLLLACKGAPECQREFRALSCRQFPFFPYVTSLGDFIGLAYDWTFEETCWVLSHLDAVTESYRAEFVATYDALFIRVPDDLEAYGLYSEQMRIFFTEHNRCIPILHREGGVFLLNPGSEHLQLAEFADLVRFGPYQDG